MGSIGRGGGYEMGMGAAAAGMGPHQSPRHSLAGASAGAGGQPYYVSSFMGSIYQTGVPESIGRVGAITSAGAVGVAGTGAGVNNKKVSFASGGGGDAQHPRDREGGSSSSSSPSLDPSLLKWLCLCIAKLCWRYTDAQDACVRLDFQSTLFACLAGDGEGGERWMF